MPFHRPNLSSICSSRKLVGFARKLISSTSPRRPADTGTRSSTITCHTDALSDPLTENLTLPADTSISTLKRRLRRRLHKGRKNSDNTKMVHTSYPVPVLPNDDALNYPSNYASSSRTLVQDDSSTLAVFEHEFRSSESASCMSLQPAWHAAPPAEQRDDLSAILDDCTEPRQEASALHEMLCTIRSTVVSQEPTEDTRTFTERDNDALRDYFSVKTNMVLTSTCPEIAPHIVITPVCETADDYYVPWRNRVDYHCQNPAHLTVAMFDPIRLARLPYGDEESYWPVARSHAGESMDHGIPHRAFSRSRFNQLVEVTAGERLTMYHVVTALQRHRFKAVAIETCERAQKLRSRYDETDVLETVEKPFQWTDPAEPFMNLPNFPGIVLFDSPNPFGAPHIMVWTPPQQDPWIPYSTATNDPQDGGHGRYLVVPSRNVSFINMPPSRYGDIEDDEDDESYESYESIDDDSDICDSPSEPSSPELLTPVDLDDECRYRPWDSSVHDDEETTGYDSNECYASKTDHFVVQDIPLRPSKPLFYFDDEEEDDLPPLDDWYIGVAQRNGIQLTT